VSAVRVGTPANKEKNLRMSMLQQEYPRVDSAELRTPPVKKTVWFRSKKNGVIKGKTRSYSKGTKRMQAGVTLPDFSNVSRMRSK
jgi:hypothetical protein